MKIKKFVLGIGILIVYGLVLWQGIQAFYPEPEYGDFCDEFRGKPFPIREGFNCIFPEGLESRQNACFEAGGEFRYEYDENGCIESGFCDECRIGYDEKRDVYSRHVFYVSLAVGIITFILGFSLLSVEPVGSALLASGVWAVFFGTAVNWRNFSNLPRFLILLVVLVMLIWFAMRLGKKSEKKKR